MNTEQFIVNAKLIHGDKYDYSKVTYVNNCSKVEIICPKHGSFWQTPQSHVKNKSECKLCSIQTIKVDMANKFDSFKKEFKRLYPEHDLIEPKSFLENLKFTFVCSKHGKFVSTANLILNKWQCPICNGGKIPEHFQSTLNNMYPNYNYSNAVYNNRDSNIDVVCSKHGKFSVHFRRHLRGLVGCQGCKNEKFKPIIKERTLNDRRNVEEISRKKQFEILFGDSFKYLKYEKGVLTYECKKHGLKSGRWCNISKGKACKECAIDRYKDNYKLSFEEFILKSKTIHGDKYDYSFVDYENVETKVKIICPSHGEFYQIPRYHFLGHGCKSCNVSNAHVAINNLLDQLNIDYIVNDRSIINPYEIDTYIDKHKIGIEVNGLYWHSYDNLSDIDSNRHINKLKLCENNNLRLFQFTDYEIKNKFEIVKSMIKNALMLSETIYARKLKVITADSKVIRKFLSENHLKGSGSCNFGVALTDGHDVFSVMSFIGRNGKFKIDRLATKIGYNIVGGASKMFKEFINKIKPNEVITYADARYATGGVYNKLGMKFDGVTRPGYCYVKNNKIYSRQTFQKHKLKSLFDKKSILFYDKDLSEREIMLLNGFRLLFDCGNFRFVYKSN